eukprot:CAMPEP_0174250570 /NCGR_PEP_ID=MMETSP0439-20130205/708_1 /TAXON_ID=0 /ORGANISM="Stereomyxa ramosa, Strain Chinc5" /LENGTH=262 /DNA_ID=CAMNT_0015330687 /DNA_START=22 /DNA_END=810 /DNA_ORIENTATION=-
MSLPQGLSLRGVGITVVVEMVSSRNGETTQSHTTTGHPPRVFVPPFVVILNRIQSLLSDSNILDQLYTAHQPEGPPPATQEALEALPDVTFTTDEKCTICLERIELTAIQLPCKHFFHKDCVTPWLKKHNTCPLCRESVENILKKHPVEKQQTEEVAPEAEKEEEDLEPPCPEDDRPSFDCKNEKNEEAEMMEVETDETRTPLRKGFFNKKRSKKRKRKEKDHTNLRKNPKRKCKNTERKEKKPTNVRRKLRSIRGRRKKRD